jgi:Predicted ATPase
VLDIKTRTLSPHSPKYGFRYVLPYDYDPIAVCTAFDFFINDVMMGDQDQIKILQEYMGYIMSGSDYIYNKALWLAGSGRNGKSTFIDILKALIGKGNYSILSIKEISEEKFSRDCLDGKLANFSEETTPEELHDSGPFKNLTGEGGIRRKEIRRKA